MEFSRTDEADVGQDLKLLKWGVKGTELEKYGFRVPNDIVQTFRNFVTAIVDQNNTMWSKRDAVLILLDEFDQIEDKTGLGSVIKSLSSPRVKFAVCGIGSDLNSLIADHGSVGRLIEQGPLHVTPMTNSEVRQIFSTASELFKGKVVFEEAIVSRIATVCEGYPILRSFSGNAASRRETGRERIKSMTQSSVAF